MPWRSWTTSVSKEPTTSASLGARLGFAIGEKAPERLLSLALCGNQPYAWPVDGPMLRAVADAVAAGREHGMIAFVEKWESSIGERFPEPGRRWMLENDPRALDAAFRSLLTEGSVSKDLTKWNVPCLIYAGEEDEMHARSPAPRSSRSRGTRISPLSGYRINCCRAFAICSVRLCPDRRARPDVASAPAALPLFA